MTTVTGGSVLLLLIALELCNADILYEMEADSRCTVRQGGAERIMCFPCKVETDYLEDGSVSNPSAIPSDLQATAKCYNMTYPKKPVIEISWSIKDSYKAYSGVFKIMVRDLTGRSSLMENTVGIFPNKKARCIRGKTVHYRFLYTGDHTDGPFVNFSGEYFIRLETAWMNKTVIIPETICEDPVASGTEATSVAPINEEPIANVINILSITGMVLCVLIAITIVRIVISAKRRRRLQSPASTGSEINVLVLANETATTDGRLAELAGQFVFDLQASPQLKVKFNTSQAVMIGKIGIGTWIRENFTWADKVIVISIPDHLRTTTNQGEAFDEAIACATEEEALQGVDQRSKIIIAHFEEEQQHSVCAFMRRNYYRRYHVYREWEKLLEALRSESSEEEHRPFL